MNGDCSVCGKFVNMSNDLEIQGNSFMHVKRVKKGFAYAPVHDLCIGEFAKSDTAGEKIDKTIRGFDFKEFTDSNGQKCSIQKSSSAMADKIWLGVADPTVQALASKMFKGKLLERGWVDVPLPKETVISGRMHLTQEMVKNILPLLKHFAETGELS